MSNVVLCTSECMHNLLEDKTKIPLRASRGLKDKSPLKLWLPRKHTATQLSDVFKSMFSQEDENSLESTSWRTLQSTVVTLNACDYHGYRFATWSRDEKPANPAKSWQQNRHSRKNTMRRTSKHKENRKCSSVSSTTTTWNTKWLWLKEKVDDFTTFWHMRRMKGNKQIWKLDGFVKDYDSWNPLHWISFFSVQQCSFCNVLVLWRRF